MLGQVEHLGEDLPGVLRARDRPLGAELSSTPAAAAMRASAATDGWR